MGPASPGLDTASTWWQSGVLYQIYVRSFADSNGDGVGDLPGVIGHLDYLQWLGVDGIWLSPITVSPNADWGYDVADYLAVDPEIGTEDDVDRLIAEAKRRHIRVLLDLVPSHTSERHPWFVDARSSRTAPHRDWYVWVDPKPDGSAPNNWVSSFGGAAWTLDATTDQYYLHNHLREQPDLNWWNDEVRQEFDGILVHWLARGVSGFRIDVCNGMIKDALLRDNPPARDSDPLDVRIFGQRPVYNGNRPEVHEVIRRWRTLADVYPGSVLVGETPVPEIETLANYYGTGDDELHLAFNFPFINAPLEAEALRAIVEATEKALPAGSWPVWTGSNHDMSRFATRWAGGDAAKARVALVMLLCLRGTPVLYQGDEIGLVDTDVPHDQLRDPLGVAYWPAYAGRDAMRTPMPWRDTPGGGFTDPEVQPWLPFGDLSAFNVHDQRDDPTSMLTLARDIIALRRDAPGLQTGPYRSLDAPRGAWVWSRGDRIAVALNMASEDVTVSGIAGTVRVGTDGRRQGRHLGDGIRLRGWEAVVVERDDP
ncbi:MAG TPA: alpha-amylase family glycosyl hydrolase [Acidimicrobiales bacterium]|jgi:alpha-glucosidase|nr:alpha-amylase family glycosyl hydrolase [Acidimicrobiales bacterium]